ncbi:MAG: hypothetical protein LBU60_06835 [Clostridiales bacterium]|jgi:hypothetical protein|nr:hypothetical protein [Clostridiales bacterium]
MNLDYYKKEKFTYDMFVAEVVKGDYFRYFQYDDKYVEVWAEEEYDCDLRKGIKWYFTLYRNDDSRHQVYSIFNTAELFLENARIDGKTIKEIWNKLIPY